MRRSAQDLAAFYATPLGGASRAAIAAALSQAWGDCAGLDLLAAGFGAPFLAPFAEARRRVAAAPQAQGAGAEPGAVLVGEGELPFRQALFDRVLAVHLLEEAPAPDAWLQAIARVLAPSGRVACVAASRSGAWARAERTPFGHGRPFSATQLGAALRDAGLEPQGVRRLLFTPPLPAFARLAPLFEAAGSGLRPPISGLVMVEAVKRVYAVRPAHRARRPHLRPALAPASAAWPARRSPP